MAHPSLLAHTILKRSSFAEWFTKVDARHGYWQVPLSDAAKPLMTFTTPWGRYCYCQNPQGLVPAGDEFNIRTDPALDRLPNFIKIVDDGLIHDVTFDGHAAHVRAHEHGITLSVKKFEFAASAVHFCGFNVTKDSFTVDPAKTSAIQDFLIPANRTDLRSFLVLEPVWRLHDSTGPAHVSSTTTSEDIGRLHVGHGTQRRVQRNECITCFNSGNAVLSSRSQALCLETDASALKGLVYALWQGSGGKWTLIQCGSHYLSDAESRYAITELKLLAVVWAVHKCALFLSGTPFDVFADHRPLIPIINQYTLDQIENPQLQRLILKIRPYKVRATWHKGSNNLLADVLSRNPVQSPTTDEESGEDTHRAGANIRACIRRDDDGQIANIPHCELLEAARADDSYQALAQAVTDGFPSHRDLQPSFRPYWSIQERLSC